MRSTGRKSGGRLFSVVGIDPEAEKDSLLGFNNEHSKFSRNQITFGNAIVGYGINTNQGMIASPYEKDYVVQGPSGGK